MSISFGQQLEFNDKYVGKAVLYIIEIQVEGNDGIKRWLEYPFSMFIAGTIWTFIGFKCTRNLSENKIVVASGSYYNIFNPHNDYKILG